MSILLTFFTCISALTACLFQSSILRNGISGLSATRLLFIALILTLSLFFVLLWHRTSRAENLRYAPHLTLSCFLTAFCTLLLIFLSGRYFENPAYDRASAYLTQAVPCLVFFAVNLLLAVWRLFRYISSHTAHGSKPLLYVLKEGRIIWQLFLILLSCLLLMLAFMPLRTNYYPSHDYSIFSYFGQQILKGKIPYTELWDHKPPLIFYINALGLLLSGGSLLGIWLIELCSLFLGACLFYFILKRQYCESAALPIVLLGVLHYVRVFDFGNYTEEFSLFFQLCALWLYLRPGKGRGTSFLIGLLCGLAFTCKQNTIGYWCAIIALEALNCLPDFQRKPGFFSEHNREKGKHLLIGASAFLLVNAIWVIYFYTQNALAEYWDVAFRFNWIYSENSGDNRLACALTTLTFLPSVTPFLLLAFLSWPIMIVNSLRHLKGNLTDFLQQEKLLCWALLALPIELFLAGLSGMNYQHYFILCIPPACVLLCHVVNLLLNLCRQHQISAVLASILFSLVLVLLSLPLLKFYHENYQPRMPSAYTKARDFLLENSKPEDPILVWGSRSAIYVMAERSAPTAFFNERPLYLFSGYVQSSQWHEFLQDISQNKPRYIIYTHDTALPFINIKADGTCELPPVEGYRTAVYSFFCANYLPLTVINEGAQDAWEVYQLK